MCCRASRKEPTVVASVSNVPVDDPTSTPVANRFAMWEKKTGDALTPLRAAPKLESARSTPGRGNTGDTYSQSMIIFPRFLNRVLIGIL